jgi:hypothetical protein
MVMKIDAVVVAVGPQALSSHDTLNGTCSLHQGGFETRPYLIAQFVVGAGFRPALSQHTRRWCVQ